MSNCSSLSSDTKIWIFCITYAWFQPFYMPLKLVESSAFQAGWRQREQNCVTRSVHCVDKSDQLEAINYHKKLIKASNAVPNLVSNSYWTSSIISNLVINLALNLVFNHVSNLVLSRTLCLQEVRRMDTRPKLRGLLPGAAKLDLPINYHNFA